MEHKKKDSKEAGSYTVGDAIKIADDINLNKEKKYNPGAFIHGLIFALEYSQYSYKIPHQQLALIKRDCRKYFKNIENVRPQKS